ncbi:MAG TPA: hypothetical protein VKZ54_03610 [Membranihabitans sp.]|nr:hypothetical protein [Membranihabitans sp.]
MTECHSDVECGEGTMTERNSSLPGIVRTDGEGTRNGWVAFSGGRGYSLSYSDSYRRLSMDIACLPTNGREDTGKKNPSIVL